MQQLPADWPADASVETIPEFQIVTDSPAVPSGVAPVSSYQIRRDLTGGGLPGAARGGSGFSVAEGSVTVPQQGTPVTPWAKTPVMPGGAATLQAKHDGATLPLGSFLVNDVSGADSAAEVTLGLIEQTRNMDGAFTSNITTAANIAGDTTIPNDAASVLGDAFRSAGYTTHMTPTVTGATILNRAYCDGTVAWDYGEYFSSSANGGSAYFGSKDGRIGLVGTAYTTASRPDLDSDVVPNPNTTRSVTFHADCKKDGGQVFFDEATYGVSIWPNESLLTVFCSSTFGTNTSFDIPASHGGDAYTVHLGINGTTVNVYLASPKHAAWELLGTMQLKRQLDIRLHWRTELFAGQGATYNDGWIGGVAIWYKDGATPPAITYPTKIDAYYEPTGSNLSGVFTADQSARETIQDIAKSTMGAAWMDETGALIYRDADHMRAGSAVEIVVADRQLEDLPWSISHENTADRIEYTYTPANIERSTLGTLTIWEATEKTSVGAGEAITITAELDNVTTNGVDFFVPIWDTYWPSNSRSRWAAASSSDGGGTRPLDDAIKVDVTITGGTAIIRVTNTTSKTLWLVDGNGEPCLILRSQLKVSAGEQQTLEWGVTKEQATNPFSFDAGQWVQDAETAQEQLNWLASQMQQAQATIDQVNVKPNLARQLGDIVVLTEEQLSPDHKPLKSKALITGSDLDGDANGYTTTLNLALLGVTFYDLDEWLIREGITTFGQLDTRLQSLGITTFGDLDAWLAAGNTIEL